MQHHAKMWRFGWMATLMVGLLAVPALAGYGKAKSYAKPDIVDTAVKAEGFNTLVKAVKAAGLVDVLKGKGPYTVFAPTDEAFAALPEETLKALLKPENKHKLQAILLYHVVPGKVMAKDATAKPQQMLGTAFGQPVAVSAGDDGVQIAGANVIKTDIKASNGMIHVIDSVILPKDIVDLAAGLESFSTLVAAVKAAGLVETLKGEGPFTVFAPTNEAFAALPDGTVQSLLKPENKDKLQAVLAYHVVPGALKAKQVLNQSTLSTVQGGTLSVSMDDGAAMINDALIVKTDIMATNGVVHVIDSVLLPE